MRERSTSLKPCPAWDFAFLSHHSCLKQSGLLSTGDSSAQVVLILFAVALSKSDRAASFPMLGFFFFLFTSRAIIPSLPLWSILFGLNSHNHLPHHWHVANTAPCSSQIHPSWLALPFVLWGKLLWHATVAPGDCQVALGEMLKWTRRTKLQIWREEGARLWSRAPAALRAANSCLALDYFWAVKTAAVASCCLPEPNISPTCPDIPYNKKVLMAAWQTSLWSWCYVVMSAAEEPSQPHQRVHSCWRCFKAWRGGAMELPQHEKWKFKKWILKERDYSGYPWSVVFFCWVHVAHSLISFSHPQLIR